VQAEYALASFGQDGADAELVETFYVMASGTLTGETKPYSSSGGVYRSVKPTSPWGAVELAARYDYIRNREVSNLKASSLTFGLNYYVNPSVRFMINYTLGHERVDGDRTRQLAARAQFAF
jgi:phosphate-selective porin OprO and OprP